MRISRLAALALAFFSAPAFSWTLVGTPGHARIASSASGSISYTVANTGDLFVVEVVSGLANTLSSISDNAGTLSTAAAYAPGTNNTPIGVYYELAASSGAHTVSVSFSGSGNYELFAEEYSYSGTASFDVASTASHGSGTSAWSTNSLTPTATGELLLAIGISGAVTWSAWTNGFVQEDAVSSTSPGGAWAALVDSGNTSISAAATLSSSSYNWGGQLVAFQATGGGSTCTNAGFTSGGGTAVPNGTNGSYRGKSGAFVTPDCSTISYKQTAGAFGTN